MTTTADRLRLALKDAPDGITMRGLHEATGRHLPSIQLRSELERLASHGVVRCESVKVLKAVPPSGGRSLGELLHQKIPT